MRRMIARILVPATLMAGAMGVGKAPAAVGVGTCTVNGTVGLADPLNNTPRKSSYHFIQTSMTCVGAGNDAEYPTMNATYFTDARGMTTNLQPGANGEDCNQGQSDIAYDGTDWEDANSWNILHASKTAGTGRQDMYGRVEFQRVGSVVLVTGDLYKANPLSGKIASFRAQLQFTPANTAGIPAADQFAGCAGVVSSGVSTARLDGTAQLIQTS